MSDTVHVTHNAQAHRFETVVEGLRCELDYHQTGNVVWMTHTGVPRELEGRGIAAQLVVAALAWVREQGLKVKPSCSYVAAYMRRHPETQDLLAG